MPLLFLRASRLAAGLLSATLLAGCTTKAADPAPLAGHWNLTSLHVTEKDANGQLTQDYTLAGRTGDYLVLTDALFQEYRSSQLNVEMPYTRAASTLTLQAAVEHLNQTREIRELGASKLVLHYQRAANLPDQSATLEATYTR